MGVIDALTRLVGCPDLCSRAWVWNQYDSTIGGQTVQRPGGADAVLKPGGAMTVTQSAVNLEDLLGKFIFNVGSLADATQKSLDRQSQNGQSRAAEP